MHNAKSAGCEFTMSTCAKGVPFNRNAADRWSPWSRIAPRDCGSATSEIPRNAQHMVSFAEQGRYLR